MGLFRRKKKEEPKPERNDASSEYINDIRKLMASDDTECRDDICRLEYEKAISLADYDDLDKLHRAYDIMGNLAQDFDYIPAIMWMGDFQENALKDLEQAVYWYKRAADLDDGEGARCYADMLMAGFGVEQDPIAALHYYSIAAEKGVPEASFVLGEFYRTNGDRENALKAYKKSFDNGYELAKVRIEQMNDSEE